MSKRIGRPPKPKEEDDCLRCGKFRKILCKGLCNPCYKSDWRTDNRGWSPQFLEILSDFPVSDWNLYSAEYKLELLDVLTNMFQSKGFPEFVFDISKFSIDSVTRGKVTFDNNSLVISSVGWSGQPFCTSLYRHRFEAKYGNNPSIREAFDNYTHLRSAIKYQLDWGDPIEPNRVLKALSAKHKTPTNFSPVLARWLVDRYCEQGGTIFDPCSGYGGRLLGSLASNLNVKYIGHDIEPLTIDSGKAMVARLGSTRAELRVQAMESGDFPNSDMILTCPPYYNREVYGKSSVESVAAYETYGAWLHGWMGLLLDKAKASTKTLVLCVSTFRLNNQKIEFPEDLRKLILSKGLNIRDTLFWETSTFGKKASGKGRQEHLFIIDF